MDTQAQEAPARPARKEAEHEFHVFRFIGQDGYEDFRRLTPKDKPIKLQGRGETVRREAIARAVAGRGETEDGTGRFLVIKEGEGLTEHSRKVKVVPQQEVEEWD